MAFYGYKAWTQAGKIKKGTIEAQSIDEVRTLIKKDGLAPVEIKKQTPLSYDLHIPGLQRVRAKELGFFCRRFASVYDSGLPIVTTLELLRKQTSDKNIRNSLLKVRYSVENGKNLSESMQKESKVFPFVLCEMVRVGEQSGNLPAVFDRMADYYEKTADTKNAVIRVMIYPCIVTAVVIAVLAVMMTQIVPKFESIYAMTGTPLPGITRAVIDFCRFFKDHFLIISLVIAAVILFAVLFSKTYRGKHFFGYITRKIPLLKSFVEKNASSMVSRTLSLLLMSGLPVTGALEISGASVKNIYYREAVDNINKQIVQGKSLSAAMAETGVFPDMMTEMAAIGESSGNLYEMLEKCAVYFEKETRAASQVLLAALEPAIMLVLIAVVAVIVFAIALPMFSMYSNFLK